MDNSQNLLKINPIFKDLNLGWYKENKEGGTIAGTYIHGIFENDNWRDQYINLIRKRKKLPALKTRTSSYKVKRESIIENLANEFDKHLNLSSLLNWKLQKLKLSGQIILKHMFLKEKIGSQRQKKQV